jgi:hypothetical protein
MPVGAAPQGAVARAIQHVDYGSIIFIGTVFRNMKSLSIFTASTRSGGDVPRLDPGQEATRGGPYCVLTGRTDADHGTPNLSE